MVVVVVVLVVVVMVVVVVVVVMIMIMIIKAEEKKIGKTMRNLANLVARRSFLMHTIF